MKFFFQFEKDEDFSDIAKYDIIYVVGDDVVGHKIIRVSASNLPNSQNIDHSKFLRFIFLFNK